MSSSRFEDSNVSFAYWENSMKWFIVIPKKVFLRNHWILLLSKILQLNTIGPIPEMNLEVIVELNLTNLP